MSEGYSNTSPGIYAVRMSDGETVQVDALASPQAVRKALWPNPAPAVRAQGLARPGRNRKKTRPFAGSPGRPGHLLPGQEGCPASVKNGIGAKARGRRTLYARQWRGFEIFWKKDLTPAAANGRREKSC